MTILGILAIVLITLFCKKIWNEYSKIKNGKKLSHYDKNGRYWKFLVECKSGTKFFIDINHHKWVHCVSDSNVSYPRYTVTLKRFYSNEELNKLSRTNLIRNLVSYDILKFHFAKFYDTNGVCFAGGSSYDFNDNLLCELSGAGDYPEINEFSTIPYDSEMKEVYDAIFLYHSVEFI